ncbi:MAG: IS982 family transposase [Cyanobacteria bacterium J06642_2]
MTSLEDLFFHVDDFCQSFESQWQAQQLSKHPRSRRRPRSLSLSEMMTIAIAFHHSNYRTFKHYYRNQVRRYCASEFPHLPSYGRFVEWMPSMVMPLWVYLKSCFGQCTGISFMDATSLKVCHNRRISQHQVFEGIAARGKTSVDWFYGFKLHLVVNERGELLNLTVTPGNVDDRRPVPQLLNELFGKVFGDKGSISQKLSEQLRDTSGIHLVTRIKRNMKNQLMEMSDKLLLRKRAIIESINDQLKNISQIEHSRHRSPVNFMVNLLGGLIAYCHQPKKPSLELDGIWSLPD